MRSADVAPYLDAIDGVGGWFDPEDVKLFALIHGYQHAAGVTGDILEVGAYHGKSTVLLGFLCRHDERLVVVDPWEGAVIDEGNQWEQRVEYPDLSRATFTQNYLRFHAELPVIRQELSGDALPQLPSEAFRFIHLDGSHEWPQVSVDVREALRLLAPGGFVAFDDMFVRHAPGVPAAVWPAVCDGLLVPFATTNKLYAQRYPANAVPELHEAIIGDPGLYAHPHTVGGHPLLSVFNLRGRRSLSDRLRPFVPPILLDSGSITAARRRFRSALRTR